MNQDMTYDSKEAGKQSEWQRVRRHLLKNLGGLPEPEVINKVWLYILKEETRSSILIESFFVSAEVLEEGLARGKPLERNKEEAHNYDRAATFPYGLSNVLLRLRSGQARESRGLRPPAPGLILPHINCDNAGEGPGLLSGRASLVQWLQIIFRTFSGYPFWLSGILSP